MSQFKQRKDIAGEGTTDANKVVTEVHETIEKAQEAPVEKPTEEPKQFESTELSPDVSNIQLNSDV